MTDLRIVVIVERLLGIRRLEHLARKHNFLKYSSEEMSSSRNRRAHALVVMCPFPSGTTPTATDGPIRRFPYDYQKGEINV